MNRSVVGRALILAGITLLMAAIAEVSATLQPEFKIHYVLGAAGIVAISAGLLAGAFQLQDK